MSKQAYLVLADGTVFKGKAFGALKNSVGEVVFSTAMTGYQEILSDPSNHGQIITMTYPLIGNYGLNRDDFESMAPVVSGLIVKEHSLFPSNWRSEKSLDTFLNEYDIPGLYGLDTRQLTRKLREDGGKRGMIVAQESPNFEEVLLQLTHEPAAVHPVTNVSTKSPYHIPGEGARVVVLDFGVRASILKELTKRNCDILVMPFNASAEEILRWRPDGVILSNGPGNPGELPEVIQTVNTLLSRVPLCGISFGHQLFSLACGAKVEKMKIGHRGSNYPVRHLPTNKTILTTQNHDYVVTATSLATTQLEVTHLNVNDQSVEGVKHKHYPAFSVQYQPEAIELIEQDSFFDLFLETMRTHQGEGDKHHATI